jgi:hypothetical protein
MFFLPLFSSPKLLVSNISIFVHGGLYQASIILRYLTIIVAFVTPNIMWGHISISCLNISSIYSAIYNFMSKVSIIKTITIKETSISENK